MAKAAIDIRDINHGGMSDSDYQGIPNSVAKVIGLDIHSKPGLIRVQQKLKKDSGATALELIKNIIPSSDGNAYLFSSESGKVWSRNGSSGIYSLEATTSPASGSAIILGAEEYKGYIYYAMESRIGRWQLGTAWSTRDDNWATFQNTQANHHPMKTKNGVLFVGDAHLLAQIRQFDKNAVQQMTTIERESTLDFPNGTIVWDIDTTTLWKFIDNWTNLSATTTTIFTDNALDLEDKYIISALGETNNDILIGTKVDDKVGICRIFRWNTWSVTWTSDDEIPEIDIRAFLATDNEVYVLAGGKGNIYRYTGYQYTHWKKLPGDWDTTNEATIHIGATTNFRGSLLFALSNVSGNPLDQAIYALNSYASANYPRVLTIDYPISTGDLSSIDIGAIANIGDNLLVSWKNATTSGVDIIDYTNRYTGANFETRVINVSREELKNLDIEVYYKLLPANTNITISADTNYTGFSSLTVIKDSKHLKFRTSVSLTDVATVSFRISTVSPQTAVNTSPEIEYIRILAK